MREKTQLAQVPTKAVRHSDTESIREAHRGLGEVAWPGIDASADRETVRGFGTADKVPIGT